MSTLNPFIFCYPLYNVLCEGGGAALRVLECSQGFGVKIGNLSEKSIKKGTFKSKIKKRALLPLF